jgi:type IV secretion system protein VirD4
MFRVFLDDMDPRACEAPGADDAREVSAMLDGLTLLGLGVAGTLYGLFRFKRGIERTPITAPSRVSSEPQWHDPMSPGYGQEDKTYGDARFGDFGLPQDESLMREVLATPSEGIFLNGALGRFDANWDWHEERQMFYSGPRHLLTVAPTRSGKGACAIIPNLLLLQRSVICIDPKGQNAAVSARARASTSETFLLNPFNEHGLGTSRFNPLAHLSIDDPNVFADVAGLAEALIITEGKDPHWPDSGRNLVSAIILHLIATKGEKATLPEMRSILGLSDSRFVKKMEEIAASPYPFIAELAGQFLGDTSEIKNIVSTARTQTKFLSDPAIANPDTGVLTGDDFRIGDFKDRLSTLYIILPGPYMAAYARFLRLIIVSALDQLTAITGGLKTLLLLDEFALLGHLSAIETAFGLAAGYNVQIWPFVHNLGQLRDIYGETRWEEFISGSGVVQWFTPNDDFTAEYLSRRIGEYTQILLNESTSANTGLTENKGLSEGRGGHGKNVSQGQSSSSGHSTNISYSKVGMRLWPRNNVLALPEDKQFVTLSGFKFPILGVRRPYYRIKGVQEHAEPDPFHVAGS